MIEFKAWPKTPRLFRDVVITEKIDGTNGAIHIYVDDLEGDQYEDVLYVELDGTRYMVAAQSRKRIVTPESDNAGFARWVYDNAYSLVKDLGPGTHFGEWWGQGIQRNYGMNHKRFSLFNTAKWADADFATHGLDVVPIMYEGPFDQEVIDRCLSDLNCFGSLAPAHMFEKAEGIVIYHKAADQVFKVLLENDELPKGLVNA